MKHFNKVTIVYWIAGQKHEVVFHDRFNYQYDVFMEMSDRADMLIDDESVATVWVELCEDNALLETLKFKQNGVIISDEKVAG